MLKNVQRAGALFAASLELTGCIHCASVVKP